jgi:hypothetical protein
MRTVVLLTSAYHGITNKRTGRSIVLLTNVYDSIAFT